MYWLEIGTDWRNHFCLEKSLLLIWLTIHDCSSLLPSLLASLYLFCSFPPSYPTSSTGMRAVWHTVSIQESFHTVDKFTACVEFQKGDAHAYNVLHILSLFVRMPHCLAWSKSRLKYKIRTPNPHNHIWWHSVVVMLLVRAKCVWAAEQT